MTTTTRRGNKERESPRARDAFTAYCDQGGGERSLRRLAEETGIPFGTIAKWSDRYGWVERAAVYDQEIIAAQREAAKKEASRRSRERLRKADEMQLSGIAILSLAQISAMSPEEARRHLPTAVRLLETGVKLERLELNEATENVKAIAPPKPLSRMTDAELDAYLGMLEECT
ncbi:MAG: hypothetical protein HC884_00880 [Chloroflexaceae bacterium]|nr:hypothetical protein [Chloroflexaceae bacterium]